MLRTGRYMYLNHVFDVVKKKMNGSYKARICKACVEETNEDISKELNKDYFNGKCGVEGCYNQAEYNIIFLKTRELKEYTFHSYGAEWLNVNEGEK